MILPPLTFADISHDASKVDQLVWECAFSNYIINPKFFWQEIEKQERVVNALVRDVGLGADAEKILEGLDEKVKLWRRWIALQKLPKVIETIKAELDEFPDKKYVLACVHRDAIENLRATFRPYGACILYAGTPLDKRDMLVRKFQTGDKYRVFATQVDAIGPAGLLTAGCCLEMVEAGWKTADNVAAIFRVHNRHQDKPVRVRFHSLRGAVDERIQQFLKRRTRAALRGFGVSDDENIFDD